MIKYQVRLDTAWIQVVEIGLGGWCYVLFDRGHASPLGLVWGLPTAPGRFDVYHSYVMPWARRQGVRKRINEEIFKTFNVIATGKGTKDGGAAFMKAQGYKYNKELKNWYLLKPTKRAAPAKDGGL